MERGESERHGGGGGTATYLTMSTPKKVDTAAPAAAALTTTAAPSSTSATATDDETDYRVVPLPQRLASEPRSNRADTGFCSNVVITSKYTAWNFLPLFLIESFRKLANAYFLLVSALQTIKIISNTHGLPSTLPALTFILAVDGVLAIIEDRRRHRADDEANSTECHVVTATFSGSRATMKETADPDIARIAWADLTVGTVVKLRNRETAPADLLLLAVHELEPSDPSGICYVETKSLDGETNLKLRHACDATLRAQTPAHIASLQGYVRCENPNKAISRFDGILTLAAASAATASSHTALTAMAAAATSRQELQQPVAMKNVILRGCQLRNTDWVYGLVLNTGADTKIMQSSVATRPKWSSINETVNRMIMYLFGFLLLLCMAAATIHVLWMRANAADQVYLGLNRTMTLQWFVTVGQYLLLMYQMIPVSLYVTMSVVLLLQALFIAWDSDLYYAPHDTRMLVRSMGLNEELGQISYVFSDKTGTLTCNVMEFRKCSINGVSYGTGMTEIGKATLRRRGIAVPDDDDNGTSGDGTSSGRRRPKVPYVNFQDDALFDALDHDDRQPCAEADFFLHLSLCHTVIPEAADDGSVRFSASSPDEQALVSAAKYFGCSFEARGLGVVRVRVQHKSLLVDPNANADELQEFQVLDVLEFTSERKRMSVVVRTPRDELWLLTKGADNMIYPLLSSTANAPELLTRTREHLESFADDALRTLTVAHRRLDARAYADWSVRFKAASASLDEIAKRKRDEPNRIDALMCELEQDLVLLGATAIEDKLQDHVPRAIARLMTADMKVWMLTGDKQETAINIAFACSLLDNDMAQLVLNLELFPTADAVLTYLTQANADWEASHARQAVVIDGECLELTLLDARCRTAFLELAMHCAGVVCCRVSPSQKAEIVTLVRAADATARTLAIGDGANDVAMIQRAHVGVGISGMEGMQAVNASDYAIAQFYFLEKLLLHHGRLNYKRMAALVGYMFYKNIFLALVQYLFMVTYGGASGQKFYSEVAFQLYNLAYTALPIGVLGVMDYDVPWDVSRHYPQLYLVGPRQELFNRYTFFKWLCSAVFEAAVVAVVVLLGFNDTRGSAGSASLLQYGVLAFTCVVLVANLKVMMWQMSWNVFSIASWILGVVAYIPSTLWLTSSLASLSATDYGGFQNTLNQPVFWLVVPMCIVLCLLRHFAWSAIQRRFKPQPWQLIQEAYVLGKKASGTSGGQHQQHIGKLESGGGGHSSKHLLFDEPHELYAMTMAMSPAGSSPARLSEARSSRMRRSSSSGFAFSYDAQTALDEAYVMRRSARSLSLASSTADLSPRGKSFSGLLV